MAKAQWYDKLSCLLVLIGALTWGLIGAFNFNLIYAILGGAPQIEQVVYILIGISALHEGYKTYFK